MNPCAEECAALHRGQAAVCSVKLALEVQLVTLSDSIIVPWVDAIDPPTDNLATFLNSAARSIQSSIKFVL